MSTCTDVACSCPLVLSLWSANAPICDSANSSCDAVIVAISAVFFASSAAVFIRTSKCSREVSIVPTILSSFISNISALLLNCVKSTASNRSVNERPGPRPPPRPPPPRPPLVGDGSAIPSSMRASDSPRKNFTVTSFPKISINVPHAPAACVAHKASITSSTRVRLSIATRSSAFMTAPESSSNGTHRVCCTRATPSPQNRSSKASTAGLSSPIQSDLATTGE